MTQKPTIGVAILTWKAQNSLRMVLSHTVIVDYWIL